MPSEFPSSKIPSGFPPGLGIDEPGIYDTPAENYHRDPCPEPSLSASIANELLANSPRHAWYSHPRLNPAFEREEREIFDLGTAAHAYLLEGKEAFALIDADDWRTKAAKEARDVARLEGKTPILRSRWDDILAMANATNRQLDAFRDRPRPLSGGKPEQTLVWREGNVWCRARLDWLHDGHRFIDDLKSTGTSANPESWARGLLYSGGYDLQAAFYLRGLKVLFGIDGVFRFIVIENTAPFALSVIALGPEALVIAEKKRRMAVELWDRCISTGEWPAYPDQTCYAALPSWEETKWVAREERDLASL